MVMAGSHLAAGLDPPLKFGPSMVREAPVQVPADPGTDVPHRDPDLRRGVWVPAHGGTLRDGP